MKTLYLFLAFCFILLASGCKTENPTTVKPKILDSIEVVTDTASIDLLKCLDFTIVVMNYNPCVIRDSATYQFFLDTVAHSRSEHPCDTFKFPAINFNRFTLIGRFLAFIGDHQETFCEKTIYKNNFEKKYVYSIKSHFKEGNNSFFRYNWLLIPRVPDDWRVEFDTTTVYIP